MDDDENVANVANVASSSRKRCYTFINRVPKERSPLASSFYLTLEPAQAVSCIDCCEKRCCQLANCDALMRVCQDFWGQSQAARTNYVYDVLSMCWHQDLAKKI